MKIGKNCGINLLLWLVIILSLQACGMDKLTAEESFNRAVAGLAGIGNLTFKGNAVFRSGDRGIYKQSIAFQGQLEGYKKLTVTTSASSIPFSKAAGYTSSSSSQEVTKRIMKYDGKRWRSIDSLDEKEDYLSSLNPLEQLQFIGISDKIITEEAGAARGTKVLRIELDPEASLRLTKEMLNGQMKALRNRIDQRGDVLYTNDPIIRSKLQAICEKETQELNRLLDHANVSTVLHLTIDKKTFLPLNLSSERRISVSGSTGLPKDETLIYKARFLDYR
ncbi:hypothetical protein [Paenibacillus dakarensis]|uniref:hypothetical protein n=1 Tax=Paenibacillus dakarensis TaxID=1527293 RepID=UPI0006D547C6|nr:hypothetical protein [Paenibacillus dakarensis]